VGSGARTKVAVNTQAGYPLVISLTGDVISAFAIAGVAVGWIPWLGALAGLVWYAIQIYESKTFQSWMRKRRRLRSVRKARRVHHNSRE